MAGVGGDSAPGRVSTAQSTAGAGHHCGRRLGVRGGILRACLVAALVGVSCRRAGSSAAATSAPLRRFLIMARLGDLSHVPAAREQHRAAGMARTHAYANARTRARAHTHTHTVAALTDPRARLTVRAAPADADLLVLVCAENASAAPPPDRDLREFEVQLPAVGPAGATSGQPGHSAPPLSRAPRAHSRRGGADVPVTPRHGDAAQSAASRGRAHRKYGASPG